MQPLANLNFCTLGKNVINIEAEAVLALTKQINESFVKACQLLLACQGRVVVTGMGKSGHIGHKIASTFASTGTPAFFLHPGEACHGDLGMITPNDLILAISCSGNTEEIITLLPLIAGLKVPLITLTGNPNSLLATTATVNIDLSIKQEACPLGLAPTTSTTVSLVMGDALAIALLQARGFSAEDFARSHPGGTLGKRLFLRIDKIWHQGEALPVVKEYATISEALIEVTAKKLGMTSVINEYGYLTGVFTDGDIRRTLTQQLDINTTMIKAVMSANCKTIKQGMLAVDALAMMQKHNITSLVVVEDNKPLAVVHLHDLLGAGVL